MRILFLDDDATRHRAFRQATIGHEVDFVWTAQEAIKMLSSNCYDLACLDHDLGGKVFVDSNDEEGTGYTVAKSLIDMPKKWWPREVVVHTFNPEGAWRMMNKLREAGVRVIKAPFGTFSIPAPGVADERT